MTKKTVLGTMACFWNCDCRHIPGILSGTEDRPTIGKWALSFRIVPQNSLRRYPMKTKRVAFLSGVLSAGLISMALLGGTTGDAFAHVGAPAPPVHPPVHPSVHPAVHPHAHGAANMGITHMSLTGSNFGQDVSAIADTQGKTISRDAQSGMTGQKLSSAATRHGDQVSDMATGQTPALPPPPAPGTPPPPPPGAPAPPPAP